MEILVPNPKNGFDEFSLHSKVKNKLLMTFLRGLKKRKKGFRSLLVVAGASGTGLTSGLLVSGRMLQVSVSKR